MVKKIATSSHLKGETGRENHEEYPVRDFILDLSNNQAGLMSTPPKGTV
jgi:hypothetical protein